MPANKNAVVRYRILDELLADRHHYYTRKDLCDKCNEKLLEKGYGEVTKRTIEMDLHDMETEFEDISIDWDFVRDGKRIVRYEDQSKSIFSKKLSRDETLFLNEVLNTLGQFSGLDNFEWLDAMQSRLDGELSGERTGSGARRTIISFSRNPYLSDVNGKPVSNILAGLFSAIANKVAVRIEYQKFGCEKSFYDVCPYMLRQYNDRWFLVCQTVNPERDFLMTLALDRMLSFKEIPEIAYRECYCDIDERYEDIVGITYFSDREVEDILFAVSKTKAPYIMTKPIHGSQTFLPGNEQETLRKMYPQLDGYLFFRLECIPNNELKEIFYSFDKDIVVLHDGIRDEIYSELLRQAGLYSSLREGRKP